LDGAEKGKFHFKNTGINFRWCRHW